MLDYLGNTRICKYMLELELPVASYSRTGESIIVQMIENLPTELARMALGMYLYWDIRYLESSKSTQSPFLLVTTSAYEKLHFLM